MHQDPNTPRDPQLGQINFQQGQVHFQIANLERQVAALTSQVTKLRDTQVYEIQALKHQIAQLRQTSSNLEQRAQYYAGQSTTPAIQSIARPRRQPDNHNFFRQPRRTTDIQSDRTEMPVPDRHGALSFPTPRISHQRRQSTNPHGFKW